ncbi:MAG: FtsW/RodA/SpoVE family cell cycle protein [Huintestinicola sp.]
MPSDNRSRSRQAPQPKKRTAPSSQRGAGQNGSRPPQSSRAVRDQHSSGNARNQRNGQQKKNKQPNPLWNAVVSCFRRGEIDVTFLIIIMILLVIGIIMMYSASYAWAINKDLPPDYFFTQQLQKAAIGIVVLIFFTLFDYHWLGSKFITYAAGIGSVVLMLMALFSKHSLSTEDAKRWIEVGSFQFQPSEILKLALIMFFAYTISRGKSLINNNTFILIHVLILGGLEGLLAAQRHISGMLIIGCIGLFLLFISGMDKMKFFVIVVACAGVGLLAALAMSKIMNMDYLFTRINVWMDPFSPDVNTNDAWQTTNSLIAIGSGGTFGLGLGNSRQKFLYLPASQNDFVFAIVCEELGLVGATVVIILFLLLILRGFSIASNSPDKYGMLLAAGITFQIGLQALLNIAVVTNAFPNTGISLPFFSYGGTALVIQLAEMGIILSVSRESIPNKNTRDADDASAKKVPENKASNRERTDR